LVISAMLGLSASRQAQNPAASAEDKGFLDQYWRRPVPPQGAPPAAFTPIEASLAPQDCGVCHPVQYQDWQTSVHAQSMGPGVMGQLVDMLDNNPGEALFCQTCHAPLTEQLPKVQSAVGGEGVVDNPHYQPALREQGLVCAACHVRQHQRFGPPKQPDALPSPPVIPHGGVTRTAAFERSEFCMGCHQFDEDGFALNGKLLENTYQEWQASRYAKEGVQCQNCHMPDRRHLWRGIHDSEMVKSGVTIALTTQKPTYRPGGTLQAALRITNSGVGHYFPTYLTPRVVVRFGLLGKDGQPVPDTQKEAVIGRDVPLDLSRELSDTRIPPGETVTINYTQKIPRAELTLRATVTVEPDYFYSRFFQAILDGGQVAKGHAQIQQALQRTQESPVVIFEEQLRLP
ncbi:MAG TPA: multiheme c-type cytochrome, partial [Candidatus Tectomicrobia bacterium]